MISNPQLITQAASDDAGRPTTVTITNSSPSPVAFLLRADVRRGTASGQELAGDNELQSSIWQNNGITPAPSSLRPEWLGSSALPCSCRGTRRRVRRMPGLRGLQADGRRRT